MEKKYTYFISSTFVDLEKERQAVINYIMEMEEIPIGMESFGAVDRPPWEHIQKLIDTADYYILIIAGKYGSIYTGDDLGLSFTHKEYRYASDKGIPVIAIIHESPGKIPREYSETDPDRIALLDSFKAEVKAVRLTTRYVTTEDIIRRLGIAVPKAKRELPRPGWVRNTGSLISDKAIQERNQLRDRISLLERELSEATSSLADALKTRDLLEHRISNLVPPRQPAPNKTLTSVEWMSQASKRLSGDQQTGSNYDKITPISTAKNFSVEVKGVISGSNPNSSVEHPIAISSRMENAFSGTYQGQRPKDLEFIVATRSTASGSSTILVNIRADTFLSVLWKMGRGLSFGTLPLPDELRMRLTQQIMLKSDHSREASTRAYYPIGRDLDDAIRWLERKGFFQKQGRALVITSLAESFINHGHGFT